MKENRFKNLLSYFLQGLIILAPIAITIFAVTALFNFIDSILPNLLHRLFPNVVGVYEDGTPKRIPGLGFVVVILIVLLVGYISSSFLVGNVVNIFGRVLERIPGIKVIYTTVKDFFEAFAGDKKKFNRPVLVNLHNNNVWQIGFITRQELDEFGLHEHMAVYVPFSYSIAGQLFFVPADRVREIEKVTSTEAMKFAISGGVTQVEE
ncbi:MAG TPA: DUF502 domain-containing protein [Chitinophagaceae bacterium]|nr:DUF502 domain-containing protein [Chitinophagaceae bacterium]